MTRFGTACLIALTLIVVGCEPYVAEKEGWDAHTQGLPFIFGFQPGMEKAQETGKPAMMFVTTTWCGFCKQLAEENFNDPEIRKKLEDNFVLVIVDGDTEPQAAEALGAMGYPHVVFLKPDGETITQFRGYKPPIHFKRILQDVLSEETESEPTS